MRLSCVWVSAAASFLTNAAAQAGAGAGAAGGLAALAAALPPCGLQCIIEAIPQSGCAPTNQTCICTNPQLTEDITLCVAQHCTIRESLTTKNVTSTTCGAPIRDRTKVISVAGVVGGVIALVCVILRMVARLPQLGGQFGMDDGAILLATCLLIPLSALSAVLADDGLGRDMWTIPFDNITHILYIYFLDESIYLSILPLTKISILFFYLRIFPKKSFRIATYIVIAINVGYLIAFVLVSVFQCRPLDAAWTRWDGEHPAVCNNINAQGWASAAINVILDLLTMSLPLRELSKLSLSMRRKCMVMFMFSLGFFVTIVSILRLHSLIEFATTQNLSWDYVPLGYWSTIEADVGIICACLPAVRSLLFNLFPSTFGSSAGASKATYGQSRSQTTGSRLDGKMSQRPTEIDDHDFIPLVNVSSEMPKQG